MKKRFWDLLFFIFSFAILFSPYIILAFKIAPLNEEEWFVGEKHFIFGFDKGKSEPLITPYSCHDLKDSSYYHFSKKEISDDLYIVFSKLPPLVFLCAFGRTFYILGWGHVGPISLTYYKLFENIFGPESILSARISSLIIIILIAIVFTYKQKNKKSFFFFLSFPVFLFFVPVADIYYSLLYLFSLLSFFSMLERNFKKFYFWSSLSILTHLRGFVIFLSFFISFVLFFRSDFKKVLDRFAVLIPASLFIYFLPSFASFKFSQDIYTVEAFSSFEMIKFFLLNVVGRFSIIFQLIGTRFGDVIVSSNIALVVKELGLLKTLPFWFLIFSIVVSVSFFLPAFLNKENLKYLVFFFTYFLLSLIAVPFFGAMPWQFIPVNFLILIPSFSFLEKNMFSLFVPLFLGFTFNLYSSLKLENIISEYALWKNHKEVIEVLRNYVDDKEVFAITKSNIFHLYYRQVEAKYFVLMSEERKQKIYLEYLAKILSRYDVIILSRHFYGLEYIIPKDYREVFSNEVFRVFHRD